MALPAWLACAPDDAFPAEGLLVADEARLGRERNALRENVGHYGLVFPVEPALLERFMARIRVHGDGADLAPGTSTSPSRTGAPCSVSCWSTGGRRERRPDSTTAGRSPAAASRSRCGASSTPTASSSTSWTTTGSRPGRDLGPVIDRFFEVELARARDWLAGFADRTGPPETLQLRHLAHRVRGLRLLREAWLRGG